MNRLPDFLVIGAMKCATSTLHEQLAAQPGILMSTPKEICFFSDDDVYARGVDWYRSHFDGTKDVALCGESSTHYTKLPTYPETVTRMGRHLDRVKLIYVMRHPIDRTVSQYIHQWTERQITVPFGEALGLHPELLSYSEYARQLRPYFEAFSKENVLPVFARRLREDPQGELERVARFIGYEGTPRWNSHTASENVSAQRLRKSRVRDAVAYAPGISLVRRKLVPQPIRNRIKQFWRIGKRPDLTDSERRQLVSVFDADLEVLGEWLGEELNCSNFNKRTAQAGLDWSAR